MLYSDPSNGDFVQEYTHASTGMLVLQKPEGYMYYLNHEYWIVLLNKR